MTLQTTTKIGKRGNLVIPRNFRKITNLKEDDLILIGIDESGKITIEPAIALPAQTYTLEQKAEFLLSNAVDDDDYKKAKKEVARMGLNPDKIKHFRI
jgi:bifunctional DNA-binding transcriptional regulator/antitoxin component of YhaV-PrlF toxin-antitoxin module